ncbi:NADH-ubiquinone oxidoreductase chain D [Pyrodictium delaneyi]|uniref:NADH dehydrogenase subunit D n=1 Tax=Pyrodictium delaneyi TaxID=1273541 RepID=A0A0P0N5F0_9CREN|nr:NADH-quinone oxidoreductase subunit D [Pyrodictium delaneyi]ALL01518.1 NADH-ubiquinone oxidoreductase chain D [Pyrodictium delaneyi]OWJ54578.1 NADH dehydrogenase subunit D [Pyrodictium delaneyi]
MTTLELPGILAREAGTREGYRVVELFIGAQHPASGHMRLIAYLDGDIVVRVDPDIGYVHRTMEKLAEQREYVRVISLLERMTIIDACNITLPYVEAVERLLGVEPPPRAKYLRTILCEINRIASHLYGLGIGGIFLNHSTMYMWAFGDREVFVHLASLITGSRLTHTYPIPGGVRRDLPQVFRDEFEKAKRYMLRRLKEYDKIFFNNPVVRGRLENVGVLSRHRAITLGATGPNLRASGVRYDARLLGYAAYGELGYEPVVGSEGDALERVWVRLREIEASLELIDRALREMPEGPILAEQYVRLIPPPMRKKWLEKGRVKLPGSYVRLKTKPGEVITRGEMGRGEVTYFLVSDGGVKPYRLRVVTPSARNLVLFDALARGHTLMDLPAIYGSLDYFPPEADR